MERVWHNSGIRLYYYFFYQNEKFFYFSSSLNVFIIKKRRITMPRKLRTTGQGFMGKNIS
ncbi:MAG: hypothetical protein CVV49_12555 [Spirochaetae bacterium HGW-Spirochaetae-5]|nr:MAG: hypothetical protein CVV49_12555 [Spirochaetae bacterium HGW-Spirochaetae-5]